MSEPQIIAVHNGSYHADDVFAVAVMTLWFQQNNQTWSVIRTRDQEQLAQADYVFDVGEVYDHGSRRYDHHQKGGADTRGNGIPYASFGLAWRHYGLAISQDRQEVFDIVESRLVQPIDAGDTGVDTFSVNEYQVLPYTVQNIISSSIPVEGNDEEVDQQFLQMVEWARVVLENELRQALRRVKVLDLFHEALEKRDDERVVVLTEPVSRRDVQAAMAEVFPEDVLYVAFAGHDGGAKGIAMPVAPFSFELRQGFPEAWRGQTGDSLQQVTGIPEAEFCHNTGFLCTASSLEGVMAMISKALEF